MESQFTSPFWHYYIVAIVVASFIYVTWLLLSQDKVKLKKGEEVKTTGHSWDGIEEYNNPMPRWWFWMFVFMILFSAGYLVVYPGLGDYKGVFNWTSHNQYEREVAAADKTVNALYGKYSKMKVEDVAKDQAAMTIGKNLFATYCIQCHGSDAQGSRGFPNLTDSDWIYGGTPEKIHETITNGRIGIMMPWGPNLGTEGVRDVANYVISLSKDRAYDEDRAARGKEIFQANCVACHGANGQGTMGIAPRLNDNIWLWGGSEKAIIETITSGRHNQMPAWKDFLTEDKIHLLTAYVWGKSHPKNQALPTDSTHEPAQAAAAKPAPAAAPVPAAASTPASAPAAASAATPAAASATASAAAASEPAADQADVAYKDAVATFYFATGKSDVAANADKVVADLVAAGKNGKKLIVSGYTDSTGNAATNAELSKKRAQAVQAFLEKQGVDAKNIELRKPENTTAAAGNNAQGRRVEVKAE